MTETSVTSPPNPFTVALSDEEFESIGSCASSLHSALHKTPELDANEKLDVVAVASATLSRVVAAVNERLSDELHGD
ncbi:MAG TPA: hypothetical protein VLU25_12665 [Acidobacteriota bacterium]|nr:hypothetical protein [Acidobacteriota bacterium]